MEWLKRYVARFMRSSGSPGVPMLVVAQPASDAIRKAPAQARINASIGRFLAVKPGAILTVAAAVRLRSLRFGDFPGAPALRQVFLELADACVEPFALHGIVAGHGLREPQLVDCEREVSADHVVLRHVIVRVSDVAGGVRGDGREARLFGSRRDVVEEVEQDG